MSGAAAWRQGRRGARRQGGRRQTADRDTEGMRLLGKDGGRGRAAAEVRRPVTQEKRRGRAGRKRTGGAEAKGRLQPEGLAHGHQTGPADRNLTQGFDLVKVTHAVVLEPLKTADMGRVDQIGAVGFYKLAAREPRLCF